MCMKNNNLSPSRCQGFCVQAPNSRNMNRFYHQIGNAVCPPVIAAIAEAMVTALQGPPTAMHAHAPEAAPKVIEEGDSFAPWHMAMKKLLVCSSPKPSIWE